MTGMFAPIVSSCFPYDTLCIAHTWAEIAKSFQVHFVVEQVFLKEIYQK